SRRAGRLRAAARLRQRRLRQAAQLRRLHRGRRRGPLAPARRPLPRPRPVLLRAHLRAAPAAGPGAHLAGHRRPGAPRAARAARERPRGHLTPEEAGQHAARANARRVVITHLSDELGDDWAQAEAEKGYGGDVEVAREGAIYEL